MFKSSSRALKKIAVSISLSVLSLTSQLMIESAISEPVVAQLSTIPNQFENVESRATVREFVKRLVILNYLQETASPNYQSEYDSLFRDWQSAKENARIRYTSNSYKVSEGLYYHKQYQTLEALVVKFNSLNIDSYQLSKLSKRMIESANMTASHAMVDSYGYALSIYAKECKASLRTTNQVCKF